MLGIVQRGGTSREKPPTITRGQASRLPWAWDSLCFAVPFHEDSSQYGLRDVVSNVAPTVQVGVAWGSDNRGNPAVDLGTSSYLEYPNHPMQDRPSTEVTVYARLRRTGPAETYGGLISNVYDTVPPYLSWGIQQNNTLDGTLNGWLSTDGLEHRFGVVANVISTTEHVSAFMRWRTGETAWLDVLGERSNTIISAPSDTPIGGSITYLAGAPLRINTTEDLTSGNEYSGLYSQCMVWSRRLTDTELLALVADPFGWYSPRRETVAVSSPYPLLGGQSFMREVSSG